ncbi:PorT family protein [Pedobacter polaris]|uniref:PorT family protein n=1 Tax=Pedobacter polaris TaxID=2571273 RepID=A0A4U1CU15_9SPHI|nr:outer membrane beta-barrel protein [Pedobacter polaris]TKC12711.1 PorT family protein [Pedobacter polaris]
MKPTEPNKPLNTELIAHVRERLLEHEEAYVQGAWEKFNVSEKKQRPLVFMPFLQGAAAILLIGFITFLLTNKKPSTEQDTKVVTNKTQSAEKVSVKPKEVIANNETSSPFKEENLNAFKESVKINHLNQEADKKGFEDNLTNSQNQPIVTNSNQLYQAQKVIELPAEKVVSKPIEQVIVANKGEEQKVSTMDFLENETKNNKDKKSDNVVDKKQSKFTLGLVVAPSFGNVKKLNMGYGVSVDYSLSDKFSLNSGIAYNQMAASKGADKSMSYDSPVTNSAIAKNSSTKSLESVEERVTGIDIPLEIKYHVNKNFYANFGVSAFAVINQKRNNTYIEEKLVQQSAGTSAASIQFSNVLVSERVTEKEEPAKIDNYSYLGFYNLSFGYKKKISKHNSFAIEPFLKLPMKEVKTENLKLIGTGVKLKFDF